MLLQILVGGLVVFIIFFSCFGQSERAICRAMTIRSQETERTEISHDRPASSHKKDGALPILLPIVQPAVCQLP